MTAKKKVRVLRIVEYYGDQDAVNAAVESALHGRLVVRGGKYGDYEVTAATVNSLPKISKNVRIVNEEEKIVN